MNSARVLVRLTAALLVAGIANACASDRGSSRSVAGPFAPNEVADGAVVHGRLTRTLRLLGPDGSVRAESTTTEAFDATVVRGRAATDHGPLVALAMTRPASRQPVAFTDSAGRRHQIEFERGGDGEPVRLRASLDGRPIVRVEFTWRRAGHGFVLAHRSTTFFGRDGREAAREDLTTEGTEIASAGPLRRGLASLAAGIGAAAIPEPLAAVMVNCLTQWIYYGFASLGVAASAAGVLEQPWNPRMWIAFGAAVGVWDKTLDALLDCMVA
jgi:hypothetical protein